MGEKVKNVSSDDAPFICNKLTLVRKRKCRKISKQHLYILNAVRRGQLSSEWRHNENDVIMRTGAASAASTV